MSKTNRHGDRHHEQMEEAALEREMADEETRENGHYLDCDCQECGDLDQEWVLNQRVDKGSNYKLPLDTGGYPGDDLIDGTDDGSAPEFSREWDAIAAGRKDVKGDPQKTFYGHEPIAAPPAAGFVGTYSSDKNTSWKNTCQHDGQDVLFEDRDITLGGARGYDVDYTATSLVIDLAGVFAKDYKSFLKKAPRAWKELLKGHYPEPEIIELAWPDFHAPCVGLDFWQKVWANLPKGHTIVCCMGGHGRTGTCLAALMLVADPNMSSKEAIDIVRQNHCSKAIENKEQEEYLHDLAAERDAQAGKK